MLALLNGIFLGWWRRCFGEGEEETLKQEIQAKVAEIKERFPYQEVD